MNNMSVMHNLDSTHETPRAPKHSHLPMGVRPRGFSREAAAEYIGVSTSKFVEMVADGRMPEPKQIDKRVVWDALAIDAAFDALLVRGDDQSTQTSANPWDEAYGDL